MKIEVLSERVILHNEGTLHNYFGWPTVARLHDGRLAVVASGYRVGHVCPFGKVVLITSEDDGESWSLPNIVIDTMLDDRDGGIVAFGESSAIVTSFTCAPEVHFDYFGWKKDEEPFVYKSAYIDLVERAGNWQKYLGSTFRISHDNCKSFGEIKISPVTAPHGPCAHPDGYLIYVGNDFTVNGGEREKGNTISCYKISGDGECELLSHIEKAKGEENNEYHEPHAIVLPDGKIIVHIRVHVGDGHPDHLTVYQCESRDGGKSFSEPHPVTEIGAGSPAHLLADGDTLISVFGRRKAPFGISAIFSEDGGENWSEARHITDIFCKPEDFGYPATVKLRDGKFLTVYYTKEPGYNGVIIKQIIWKYTKSKQ